MVGMDDLTDAMHIAWAPSTVNLSDIPIPGDSGMQGQGDATTCNGHGWSWAAVRPRTACAMKATAGGKVTAWVASATTAKSWSVTPRSPTSSTERGSLACSGTGTVGRGSLHRRPR